MFTYINEKTLNELNQKMNRIFIAFSIILMVSCYSEKSDSDFKITYKNDNEGNSIIGSKEELINHVRGGATIKIGWGSKGKTHSIEHLSEPIWIAVLDESEVIAHLDAQVLSKIDWVSLSANYADSTLLNQEWRVVITTKGEFDAVWYDRKNNEILKRRPQNHVITWFVKNSSKDNSPLFKTN